MIRLVYLSAALPTIKQLDLDEILASSRRNNTAAGITGLLLYGRGSFIQVLEGIESSVATRFERICKDPRHSAIKTVVKTEITARDFPDWSMGYRAIKGNEQGIEGLIDLRDKTRDVVSSTGGAIVAAFLRSFRAANIDTDAA